MSNAFRRPRNGPSPPGEFLALYSDERERARALATPEQAEELRRVQAEERESRARRDGEHNDHHPRLMVVVRDPMGGEAAGRPRHRLDADDDALERPEGVIVVGGTWDSYVRAFYAAQNLGIEDRTHEALYAAIHVEQSLRGERGLDSVPAPRPAERAAGGRPP